VKSLLLHNHYFLELVKHLLKMIVLGTVLPSYMYRIKVLGLSMIIVPALASQQLGPRLASIPIIQIL